VARERGLRLPERPLSVTALEIEAALATAPGPGRDVVFLLETSDGGDDVARLRERLRATLPDRTYGYVKERLDSFAALALEALWREIDAETSTPTERGGPESDREPPAQLEDFVEQHLRGFVGRESLLRGLLEFAERREAGVAAIVGPSGGGKSALFAKLVA